ncbi:MAG: hypothetical protein MCS20_01530, partial [Candidatus Phytoplasma mali]|nr:hypothetical protein [Candidatus Phytoplasma australiense]MCG7202075.1 hypothetical protein [Candidatus Phytoplasma mali]
PKLYKLFRKHMTFWMQMMISIQMDLIYRIILNIYIYIYIYILINNFLLQILTCLYLFLMIW